MSISEFTEKRLLYPTFRRHSKIPNVLVLHKGIIRPEDINEREGYSVVKPFKAVLDLALDKSISLDILRQALSEALQRGLIKKDQIIRNKYLSSIFNE